MLNTYSKKHIDIISTMPMKDAVELTGLPKTTISKLRKELKSKGVDLVDNRKSKKVNMEKEEVVIEKDFLKENNATRVKSLLEIISDFDEYCRVDHISYTDKIKENIQKKEEALQDIQHNSQLRKDSMTSEQKVYLFDRMGEIRIEREIMKSELNFLIERENYEIISKLPQLLKRSRKFVEGKQTRKYQVRQLVAELGETIVDETISKDKIEKIIVNRSETPKVEESDTIKQMNEDKRKIIAELDEEILNQRKYALKAKRKELKEKGKLLQIDMLLPQHEQLIKQLSPIERNKIVSLAEKYYAESGEIDYIPKTKEFVIKKFLTAKAVFDLKMLDLIKQEYWKEIK